MEFVKEDISNYLKPKDKEDIILNIKNLPTNRQIYFAIKIDDIELFKDVIDRYVQERGVDYFDVKMEECILIACHQRSINILLYIFKKYPDIEIPDISLEIVEDKNFTEIEELIKRYKK